jgi:hypothetical protein
MITSGVAISYRYGAPAVLKSVSRQFSKGVFSSILQLPGADESERKEATVKKSKPQAS